MFEASVKSTKGAGANDAFCALLGLEYHVGGCADGEEAADEPPLKKSKTK